MHNRGFPQVARLALSLVIFGLFSAATPGCGSKTDQGGAAGSIPEGVKQSNDNMENFMKSQQTKK